MQEYVNITANKPSVELIKLNQKTEQKPHVTILFSW